MVSSKNKAGWLNASWLKPLLWTILGLWLAVSLGLEIVFHRHAHFVFEQVFGFWAVFGFVGCVALCALAKLLRLLVKRPTDYYHA